MATRAGPRQSHNLIKFLGQLSVLARCGLLTCCVALAFLLGGLVSQMVYGLDGLAAAGLAALICLVAGLLGLLASEMLPFVGPSAVMLQTTVAMLLRMMLPLGCFLLLYVQKSPLLDHGLAANLIFIYLVMLGFDTWMLCVRPMTAIPTEGSGKSSADG